MGEPARHLSLDAEALARVPELFAIVERQEREIAELRRRLGDRQPLADWYDLTGLVKAFPGLFGDMKAPRKRLLRQCAERSVNGLDDLKAVKMVDGRLLIHAKRYADWIEREATKKATAARARRQQRFRAAAPARRSA